MTVARSYTRKISEIRSHLCGFVFVQRMAVVHYSVTVPVEIFKIHMRGSEFVLRMAVARSYIGKNTANYICESCATLVLFRE